MKAGSIPAASSTVDEEALPGFRPKRAATAVQRLLDIPTTENVATNAAESDVRDCQSSRRERLVANRFQEAALPRALPHVPGLELSAFYCAASDEARVGGDWYDAIRLPDGRVVLSIGDVCGSGLSAAVAMVGVRQVVRGVAHVHPDPATMLEAANRTLHDEDPERIVTAFVAVFDPVTSLLAYACAGHPRPLLRRSDGTVTELSLAGPPLGLPVVADPWVTETMVIPAGALLVLYTDGVTEATHDVLAGEARLRSVLSDDLVAQASEAASAIFTAVVPQRSNDDVAILTMRTAAIASSVNLGLRWLFEVTDRTATYAVRDEYVAELRRRGFAVADCFFAELVFAELISNVVRYAPGRVEIVLDCGGESPVLHVLDRGPGFRQDPHLPEDAMSERGRGLVIVSSLCKEFLVDERPDGGSHARAVLPHSDAGVVSHRYDLGTNRNSGILPMHAPLMLDMLVAGVEDYAIFTLDADGYIATWNAGAERFKGYRSQSIIGRHFSVFYTPEDVAAQKPERELQIAAAHGRFKDEGWRVRQDGTRFWAGVLITALRNTDGSLRGFGKITRDLTERHATEIALRTSEERLRLLVEGVKDYAIFMLDPDGRIATWNAGAQALKQYHADEIVGQHFSVFYPENDVASGKPERELHLAALDGRVEDEGWRVRRDGSRFWANVSITALYDTNGALRGFGKVTRDLTEQHAVQMALVASEERYRCSFDEAQIGMAILTLDGAYARVNSTFCKIVGYSQEHLDGVCDDSITYVDDRPADRAGIRSVLRGERTSWVCEKRYLHAFGHAVWTATTVTAIRDETKSPMHLIAQVQDITERRSRERRLEHMADHDPLTGLFNRRGFERELEIQLARVARYGPSGGLLMLDLDNFKKYNDAHGHGAGDKMLMRIATALKLRIRSSDLLARIGGDEFVVLLPLGNENASESLADALLQVVREEAAFVDSRQPVTVSIGIAMFAPSREFTATSVLAKADSAMYRAKTAGGNRWTRSGVL